MQYTVLAGMNAMARNTSERRLPFYNPARGGAKIFNGACAVVSETMVIFLLV